NVDHGPRRANGSPVGELDAEPTVLAAQQLDLRRVDVRDGVLLKPEAIVDEEGQRNWKLLRSSHGGAIAVEAIGSARSWEARNDPCRAEVQSARHAAPDGHPLPDEQRGNPRGPQVHG